MLHKLRLIDGHIFLDDKEIDGVTSFTLSVKGNDDAQLSLELVLAPDLLIDQTCHNTDSN